MKTNV